MGKERRVELNNLLIEALGSNNVYFQPPANIQMKYPCIVYERDNASFRSADNMNYIWKQRYQVTLIDRNPDSPTIDKLRMFKNSSYQRGFRTAELNHDIFVIYH